jgi:hypothetical protein
MDWRITAVDEFYDSLAQFGEDEQAGDVTEELIVRILNDPLRVKPIPGLTFRAVRGGVSGSEYPALRVLYTIAGRDVTLLRVERDEPRL